MQENLNFSELMHNMSFVIKYLLKNARLFYTTKIFRLILSTVFSLLPAYILRLIFNEINNMPNYKDIIFYLLIWGIISLVIGILSNILSVGERSAEEKIIRKIKVDIVKKINEYPYSQLNTPNMQNFVRYARQERTFLNLFDTLSAIIEAAIGIVVRTISILFLCPWIIPFLIPVIVCMFFSEIRNFNHAIYYRNHITPADRKLDSYFDILTSVEYAKEVKVNNLNTFLVEKIEKHSKEITLPLYTHSCKHEMKSEMIVKIPQIILQSFSYIFLGVLAINEQILLGDFTFLISSITALLDYAKKFISSFFDLFVSSIFAKEFTQCMEYSPDKKGGCIPMPNKKPYEIEFDNVSFHYPDNQDLILRNISFKIYEGEKISIVGLNGAGKTTIVKLLCRLYEPTEGEIRWNGIPINHIKYSEYIKHIGSVFQNYKLFPISLKENIILNREFEKYQYNKLLKLTKLDCLFNALPQNDSSTFSRQFDEKGIELSGGEQQKIAICRAWYKKPAIVILDEPTSALDPIAEHDIYKTINSMSTGLTMIMISHRMASTMLSDKIIVLEKGCIIEQGSHSELYSNIGTYRYLFDLQANGYDKPI